SSRSSTSSSPREPPRSAPAADGGSTLLTSDLVRVRRKGIAIVPAYLDRAAKQRLRPVAEALIDAARHGVGKPRNQVDAGAAAVPASVRDRVVVLGLRKLLEDRCEYEVRAPLEPERIRSEVFLDAAAAYRALDIHGELDRAAVIAGVSGRLGVDAA